VRLGDTAFDPYLAITDIDGRQVAALDDTAFGRMDPVLTRTFADGGRYIVEIRESAFGGNGNCHYRLHVGRFDRPTAMLPAGGRPGETIEVTCFALDAATGATVRTSETVQIPADAHHLFEYYPEGEHGSPASPLLLAVAPYPNVVEPVLC